MREVGAFEAKNRRGALLDQVLRGEEIVITRHGKEVARLVPPQIAFSTRIRLSGGLSSSIVCDGA